MLTVMHTDDTSIVDNKNDISTINFTRANIHHTTDIFNRFIKTLQEQSLDPVDSCFDQIYSWGFPSFSFVLGTL